MRTFSICAACASFIFIGSAHASSIEGDVVNLTTYYPVVGAVAHNDGSKAITGTPAVFFDIPGGIDGVELFVGADHVEFSFPGYAIKGPEFHGYVFTNESQNFPEAYALVASNVITLPSGSFYSTVGNAFTVNLSGLQTAPTGGSLTFAFINSPVPEPETYAMLLAGLGLMGAVARRRKLKGLPNPHPALKTH